MEERHIAVSRTARYHTLGPAVGALEVWIVCHGYGQLAADFLAPFRALDDGTRLLVAPEALSRFYTEPTPGRHGPEHPVGGTWMTRVEREVEIRDYIGYLDALAARVTGGLRSADVEAEGGEGRTTGGGGPVGAIGEGEPTAGPADRAGDPGAPEAARPAESGRVAGLAAPGRRPRLVALGFSQGVHTVTRWVCYGHTPVDRLVLWGAYPPPDLDLERALPRLRAMELLVVRGETDPHASEETHWEQMERMRGWGLEPRSLTHPGGHRLSRALLMEIAGLDEGGPGGRR